MLAGLGLKSDPICVEPATSSMQKLSLSADQVSALPFWGQLALTSYGLPSFDLAWCFDALKLVIAGALAFAIGNGLFKATFCLRSVAAMGMLSLAAEVWQPSRA